jgi:hypothetical protein
LLCQPRDEAGLRFTPHVYQRSGEVRKAEWRQIDFNKALWTMLRCAALRCAALGAADVDVLLTGAEARTPQLDR